MEEYTVSQKNAILDVRNTVFDDIITELVSLPVGSVEVADLEGIKLYSSAQLKNSYILHHHND